MLKVIDGLPDNVVGIIAKGRVTNEECDTVLKPAMERSLKRHRKIRLYYEVASRFPGAGWDDLDMAIDHLPQWERIAVVTDTGWVRQTVNAMRFLIAAEVRVFTTVEAMEGRAWIAAPVGAERLPLDEAGSQAQPLERVFHLLPRRTRRRLARPRQHADNIHRVAAPAVSIVGD